MATLADLQALSLGQSIVPVNQNQNVQVISVQNQGSGCLPCNDDVCEVDPTQAVTLDAGRFTRTTGKLRLSYDTTGLADPTEEQNIVLFSDFSFGDAPNFPRLAGLILPVYGESDAGTQKGPIANSALIGSFTLTRTGGLAYTQSDVGSLIFPFDGSTAVAPGTVITAVALDGNSVTMSVAANATDATVNVNLVSVSASANGALINGGAGAATIFELNNVLSGGSIIASIEHQYNSVSSPGSAGLEITGFHLPVDPRNAAITTISLSPLCDSCTSNNNGDFVTNKYVVGHGVTWRDGVIVTIPGSAEGSVGTLDICYGAIGLPNSQMDTWAHQSA